MKERTAGGCVGMTCGARSLPGKEPLDQLLSPADNMAIEGGSIQDAKGLPSCKWPY